MASSGKRTASVGVFVILLAAAGQVFGDISQIFDRPLGSETIDFMSLPDRILDPDAEPIPNPFSLSYSRGTAGFSILSGSCERLTEGATWSGFFTNGEAVLWTNYNPGPLTIEFSSGITAFATQIQSNCFEDGYALISAYDAFDTLLGTVVRVPSIISDDNTFGDGSAVLIGVKATGDDVISRIVLDIDGFRVDDFAINQISFVPVPVPGAVLLGLLGLSTAGLRLRRHG
ncbi:MAG TPA: hypothetical protein PKH24_14140 [Sedimentisphaerales bacterium]|jgi:hypothetical protein|nr:hypothetical protein [Sedimentisphaerales bacterium]HNU31668.1 hypothetical protein [Sedimentisphaerales bacterium]